MRVAAQSALRRIVGARSGGGAAAASAAARRRPVVTALEAPKYTRVPILSEDTAAALADLPQLLLTGPSPSQASSWQAAGGLEVPLDRPLFDEALAEDAEASQVSPQVRFAELDNGVRIAGVDRHGLCASLGLLVQCGPRHEDVNTSSMPHLLELMAFHSSEHLSHMRTMKTLEQLGAAATCRVGREDLLYQVDVLRDYVPVMLPLLLSNVLCPMLLPEEVDAAKARVHEAQRNLEENSELLVSEMIHATAYGGNTLGHPLYASEKDLKYLDDPNTLRQFLHSRCRPERLIVSAVNVDFDELCKWTSRSFAEHVPPGWEPGAPRSQQLAAPAKYTGGDTREEKPNPLCHLALGWEVEGGWNGPHLASITVLQMLLGGGGSFSTGGPGKGMHTRLYTEVLNKNSWVESCHATGAMYTDSGVFSIFATLIPGTAGQFVDVLAGVFARMLNRITAEELERAKNALKTSIHMNLEMRAAMMEDISRQLLLSDKWGSAQEFGEMIDAVTTEDLREVLRQSVRSKLTLAAYGAIEGVPEYHVVENALKRALRLES